MSYNITLTNGNLLAVIPDGTINPSNGTPAIAPPLVLIGQNYAGGYGQFQNNNYVRLLESGANSTAPAAPLVGQLWYNTTTKSLQVYNGTTFKSISGATASSTAPSVNNAQGDLWYNTADQQLSVYTGTEWLAVGPDSINGTGAVSTTISDGTDDYDVIKLLVNGNAVGIISRAATFTPDPAVSGFGTVSPGITLSANVNGQIPTFVGNLTGNASMFAGLATTAFMRADQNTQTTGRLVVLNNLGANIGGNAELSANVVSGTVNLYNNSLDNNFNIGVNKGGTKTAAIQISGSTGNVTIAGNLTANIANITSNLTANTANITGNLTANRITSNTTVTGTLVGDGTGITNLTGSNVTGTVANANSAVYSTILKTAAWTVSQSGGKLLFQAGNVTVASLDSSGNFITIGSITGNSTP